MADILENPVDLIDDAYEQEIQVEQEMIEVVAYRSYNRLDDKPQINGVELVGNKTSSDLGITAQIESAVNSEAQARAQADNTLQGKIDTEKLARQQADSTLQGNIDAEETARKAADKDIQDVLDGETLARQNADTALGGRIDTEIHDRQVADIALQGQIDAITSKSDVVDVVANYVALQAYDTSSLGNNDVIKVLDDETHEDALTYYRWSKTNQTWTFIGQEAPYYSKSQTDTLLLGKQNTIDSSHKLSADLVTDTSTTNKFVTASDITNWNGKQDALTAGTGIDITGGIISTPAIVPEVVTELPTTGAEGKLYLTPKAHTTQTATGNPIEATVTEQAGQLESFQLNGDTFQQSYEGKNLFNDATAINSYIQSNGSVTPNDVWRASQLIKVSPNTSYIWHGEVYGVNQVVWAGYDSGSAFVSGQYKQVNSAPSLVIITGENTEYIRVGYRSDGMRNMQLELGSTATSFEPFVGGQPSPSPEYPQQIQTVTGTQTVEVVGKNLFDIDSIITGYELISATGEVRANAEWWVTPLIPVKAGEAYTSSNMRVLNKVFYNENGDFVSTITTQTATAPTGASYVRMNAKLTDLSNYTGKAQLELGSTATTYTPYSKQTLPINLGKNLFDKTAQITDGYSYASDGTIVTVPTCSVQEAYIRVEPNATYTLHTEVTSSQTTNFRVYICEYTANKTFIQRDIPNPVTSNTNTITTTANTSYVRLCFSTVGIDTLQFEAGSTATTYSQYFTPIELCKIGTYQDYIWKDGESWKVHKKCKTITLNGSEDWQYSSTYDFFYAGVVSGMEIPVNAGVACYCRTHKGLTSSSSGPDFATEASNYPYAADVHTTQTLVRIKDTRFSSTQALATWLEQNNTTIYYVVKTATDTTITDTTLIAQLEAIRTASLENGTNTITNTAAGSNLAGDMEIGYYGYNPRNRYDKWLWLDINNNYEQIGGE